MNREILFRGRRTDNGDWVEGYLLYGSDKPYIVTWCGGDVTRCWDCGTPHMDYFEVDPATIGQYTGLADKNGKRIFEGDVLRCWRSVGAKGQLRARYPADMSVQYWPNWACYVVEDKGTKTAMTLNDFGAIEVIGTIHDKEAPHDRTTD